MVPVPTIQLSRGVHAHAGARACAHTHAHIHIHTHTHKHTHTHTYTHKHTHTTLLGSHSQGANTELAQLNGRLAAIQDELSQRTGSLDGSAKLKQVTCWMRGLLVCNCDCLYPCCFFKLLFRTGCYGVRAFPRSGTMVPIKHVCVRASVFPNLGHVA